MLKSEKNKRCIQMGAIDQINCTTNRDTSCMLEQWQARIYQALLERLPSLQSEPTRLHEAMHYSTLQGGKRIRPLLVYATGYLLGADESLLDTPACAIEAIQSFSLIHDDLPALDNDDLRRGQPSCHRQFDEATAILAGDALQMFAFEQLSASPQSAEQRLAMVRILSECSGSKGMIGGGSIELEISGKPARAKELEALHWLKCGKLIQASVLLGAYGATKPDSDIISKLHTYAYGLGVGYQVSNDLLDGIGYYAMLGKKPKSDQAAGRTTFYTELDIDESKLRMESLFNQAINAVDQLDRSEPLVEIVEQVRKRTISAFTNINRVD